MQRPSQPERNSEKVWLALAWAPVPEFNCDAFQLLAREGASRLSRPHRTCARWPTPGWTNSSGRTGARPKL
ncbi:unnamed protein product [Chondrus crispus]|uniref:Uncharacterized protein n=1 Tax=Chondrus crispus TaxID=2769 RepID=R7Q6U0_CHOCR|nr:unnamed protein product [Chondrus crispus]CDF33754.1 unnamed protein product [Chondrus crispus]|eukprot:XP_005713573.1 unnamed protein product [Chondrus crispus]